MSLGTERGQGNERYHVSVTFVPPCGSPSDGPARSVYPCFGEVDGRVVSCCRMYEKQLLHDLEVLSAMGTDVVTISAIGISFGMMFMTCEADSGASASILAADLVPEPLSQDREEEEEEIRSRGEKENEEDEAEVRRHKREDILYPTDADHGASGWISCGEEGRRKDKHCGPVPVRFKVAPSALSYVIDAEKGRTTDGKLTFKARPGDTRDVPVVSIETKDDGCRTVFTPSLGPLTQPSSDSIGSLPSYGWFDVHIASASRGMAHVESVSRILGVVPGFAETQVLLRRDGSRSDSGSVCVTGLGVDFAVSVSFPCVSVS